LASKKVKKLKKAAKKSLRKLLKKHLKKHAKKVLKKTLKKHAKKIIKKTAKKPAKKVIKKAAKKIIKKAVKKPIKKVLKPVKHTKQAKPVKLAKPVKPAKPTKPAKAKVAQSIIQKVRKCKKSLCKDPAVINGYCRYHYISSWKIENIDKKVKKVNHLEKTINEIKKRFPHDYLELIRADLVSDEVFRRVLKDMDLEEDINDFEISDDTQKIIESYSSLVDLERED